MNLTKNQLLTWPLDELFAFAANVLPANEFDRLDRYALDYQWNTRSHNMRYATAYAINLLATAITDTVVIFQVENRCDV
jgi:hypothetical protein